MRSITTKGMYNEVNKILKTLVDKKSLKKYLLAHQTGVAYYVNQICLSDDYINTISPEIRNQLIMAALCHDIFKVAPDQGSTTHGALCSVLLDQLGFNSKVSDAVRVHSRKIYENNITSRTMSIESKIFQDADILAKFSLQIVLAGKKPAFIKNRVDKIRKTLNKQPVMYTKYAMAKYKILKKDFIKLEYQRVDFESIINDKIMINIYDFPADFGEESIACAAARIYDTTMKTDRRKLVKLIESNSNQ